VVVVARKAGFYVKTIIRDYNEPLPANMMNSFTTKKGVPKIGGKL